MAARPISQGQMRLLWALARDRGYDQDGLRDLVEAVTGGRSISGLSRRQASDVIDRLQPARPAPSPTLRALHGKIEAHCLAAPAGAASLGQHRKILALLDLPAGREEEMYNRALSAYVGVERWRWLGHGEARKMIEALKGRAARRRRQRRAGK